MNVDGMSANHFVNEEIQPFIRWLGNLNAALRRLFGIRLLKLKRKQIEQLVQVDAIPQAFGSAETFHKMLNTFIEEFDANPNLAAMGVWGISDWIQSCFGARKECMNYVARHPEVLQQPIEKPLVILGMHRTGSTLLFNLLHEDERTRSAFMYEMYGPWPHLPVATSRAAQYTDPRMAQLKVRLDQARKIMPKSMIRRDMAHPSIHDMIEEENIIGAHQMNWFTHAPLAGAKFKALLLDEDKDFVFKYTKIYFQMLQTGYAPASHWTLKSPSHLLHLDAFMRTFSDARVVVLHRDPKVTIPSMCYLIEALFGPYWQHNTWDRRTLGPYVFELYQLMTQRLMKYRDTTPQKAGQFLDIRFADLMRDPIEQVQNIYRTFGIRYDAALTKKLQRHMAENPQHRHGKPDYTLEKYGLNAQDIDAHFREYNTRYLT